MQSRSSTASGLAPPGPRSPLLEARPERLYSRHWLLWDGECGLCARFAAWVARNDRRSRFTILPYQEAPSPPMTPALAEACERAVHVVRADGATLRAGAAVLFVLDRLGWRRAARLLGSRPLLPCIELGYVWVADHRPLVARILRIGDDAPA